MKSVIAARFELPRKCVVGYGLSDPEAMLLYAYVYYIPTSYHYLLCPMEKVYFISTCAQCVHIPLWKTFHLM